MPSLHDLKYAFFSLINTIELRDVIDIIVLAYIIYLLLKLIRETRAGQLVRGILFLVAGYFLSDMLRLKTIAHNLTVYIQFLFHLALFTVPRGSPARVCLTKT